MFFLLCRTRLETTRITATVGNMKIVIIIIMAKKYFHPHAPIKVATMLSLSFFLYLSFQTLEKESDEVNLIVSTQIFPYSSFLCNKSKNTTTSGRDKRKRIFISFLFISFLCWCPMGDANYRWLALIQN